MERSKAKTTLPQELQNILAPVRYPSAKRPFPIFSGTFNNWCGPDPISKKAGMENIQSI